MAEIRIMTFNVRGAPAEDGINIWKNRAALNVETIRACAPDVIGFQEVQSDNLETFRLQLQDYAFEVGLVSNRPDRLLFNAVFWRSDVFWRMSAGSFYLSRTPQHWSKDWDSGRVRVANWVKLRVLNTNVEFLHVNTHLDHLSEQARNEGSRVILQQLSRIRPNTTPCFLTGDFNSPPDLLPSNHNGHTATPYGIFRECGFVDVYHIARTKGNGGENTFHGFAGEEFRGKDNAAAWRIDWILALPGARSVFAKSYAVVRKSNPPLYPSDHYPVIADIEIA